MRVIQGRVFDGRILVDDELPEGASVTILLDEALPVESSLADEAELAEHLRAVDRGDIIEHDEHDSIDARPPYRVMRQPPEARSMTDSPGK